MAESKEKKSTKKTSAQKAPAPKAAAKKSAAPKGAKKETTSNTAVKTATATSKAIKKKVKELVLKVPSTAGYATGRKKESVARVWVFEGSGKIEINGLEAPNYLKRDVLVTAIKAPLKALNILSKYDVKVTTKGGGLTGQAGAVQLGIARGLLSLNEVFRKTLRDHGLLTRDMRIKERKKYGKRGARKGPQYRKR